MTTRTYTLTFDEITLDTSKLRMSKKGGQEVIDYFLLNAEYRIEDNDIVDVASFRKAIKENSECQIKSVHGDRTTIEVTLELYAEPEPPPMKPMKLVQDLADEYGVDNLWSIYRIIYKYTDCGPSIGFQITNLPSDHESRTRYSAKLGETGPVWFYCDDIRNLGTLEEMKVKGQEVVGISVSSIVEGSDAEVSGDTLHEDATTEDFWKLVEAVNEEASFLWERDNSKWYCLKSPEGEQWSFQDTWGEFKWHTDDDDKPPKNIVEIVEVFLENDGNMTWEGGWGSQTHKYDEYFPVPNTEGWMMCEYLNDCCW